AVLGARAVSGAAGGVRRRARHARVGLGLGPGLAAHDRPLRAHRLQPAGDDGRDGLRDRRLRGVRRATGRADRYREGQAAVRRLSVNDGWHVRPKANRWSDLIGDTQEWVPVTLPHDAMLGTSRSPSAGPANAYFPGGVWEYRRSLHLAPEDVGAAMTLEFEGVYRDAFVTVNGTAAAHRP